MRRATETQARIRAQQSRRQAAQSAPAQKSEAKSGRSKRQAAQGAPAAAYRLYELRQIRLRT
jgi:hypothetical protein